MCKIDFTKKVQLLEDISYRKLDDEIVIFNLGKGHYFSLNPTASVFFDYLMKSESIEEGCQSISKFFNKEISIIKDDLVDLISDLLKKEIIRFC